MYFGRLESFRRFFHLILLATLMGSEPYFHLLAGHFVFIPDFSGDLF